MFKSSNLRVPAVAAVRMPAHGAWRRTIWFAFYAAAYVAVFRLTNVLASPDFLVSPWNPETGLALAAGLLFGWPGVLLALAARLLAVLATKSYFLVAIDLPSIVLHTLCFAVPAVFLRQAGLIDGRQLLRSALVLVILALGASLVSAALQVGLLTQVAGFQMIWVLPAAITIAVGDFIGAVTVAPLLVLPGVMSQAIGYARERPIATACWLSLICGVSIIVFGLESTDHFKVFYLVFIPIIALAMSGGLAAALLAILLSDVSMMTIIYFREFSVTTATELQLLLATMAVSGLFLGGLVSDRRRMERELIDSHAQLQDSQTALMQASRRSLVSEMAAALAHELNQPLTSARNYIRAVERLLARPRRDMGQIRPLLADALAQVDGASDLIRETRSFLEKGEAPMTRFALSSAVDQSLRMLDFELRQARIRVTVAKPDDEPQVIGNRTQILQVIMNLMRNSIEALAATGRKAPAIDVSVATIDAGRVALSIRDNGPGVPDHLLPNLFMPFQSAKPGGLGLGLSLCRSIVTSHGGDIELARNGAEGSEFRFSLRRAAERGT